MADRFDPTFEAVHDGGRKVHPRDADSDGADAHGLQIARRDRAARHIRELIGRATGSQVAREGAVNDRDGLFDRHRDEWQAAHNNTCVLPAEEVARDAEPGRVHLHDPQRGELMPEGVREGGRGEITCDSPADADGARVRLRIADDGPGVPVDERARIFERFCVNGAREAVARAPRAVISA